MEEIELYLDDAKDTMDGAIKHLIIELGKIRAGKASPQMLEGLQIDYYGSMTPIQNVATINTPDARTLAIDADPERGDNQHARCPDVGDQTFREENHQRHRKGDPQ